MRLPVDGGRVDVVVDLAHLARVRGWDRVWYRAWTLRTHCARATHCARTGRKPLRRDGIDRYVGRPLTMIGCSSFVCMRVAVCMIMGTAMCTAMGMAMGTAMGTAMGMTVCTGLCTAMCIPTMALHGAFARMAHQHAVARVQVVDLRGPIGGPISQPRDREHLAVRAGVNLSTPLLAVRQRSLSGAALLDGGAEAEAVFERAREGPPIAGAGRKRFWEAVALEICCPAHHRGLRAPQHGQRLRRAQVHGSHASAGFALGGVGRRARRAHQCTRELPCHW